MVLERYLNMHIKKRAMDVEEKNLIMKVFSIRHNELGNIRMRNMKSELLSKPLEKKNYILFTNVCCLSNALMPHNGTNFHSTLISYKKKINNNCEFE